LCFSVTKRCHVFESTLAFFLSAFFAHQKLSIPFLFVMVFWLARYMNPLVASIGSTRRLSKGISKIDF